MKELSEQLSILGYRAEEMGLGPLAQDIRALAARALVAQPAPMEVELRRIICRSRDLNARGRGTEEYRRVLLPTGESGWASDLAVNLVGDWSHDKMRYCTQRGEFPVGTVVLALKKSVPARGPATAAAGRVVSKARGEEVRLGRGRDDGKSDSIEWGLATRKRGKVTLVLVDGTWVKV
jgi:hypothetical protein